MKQRLRGILRYDIEFERKGAAPAPYVFDANMHATKGSEVTLVTSVPDDTTEWVRCRVTMESGRVAVVGITPESIKHLLFVDDDA